MEFNIFNLIAILGLIFILIGTFLISSKRKITEKYTYPFLIAGGVCLLIYSVYIDDLIFIILQSVFIISNIYGYFLIKQKK